LASVVTLAVLAVLIASLALKDPNAALPQLAAGQIVDKCGKFRFPDGNRILQIWQDDVGNTRIVVHAKSSVASHIPFTQVPYKTVSRDYIPFRYVFESERGWFASVDQYDRLWVYYGGWDKQWGQLRKLPSGWTRPYPPAVTRHGVSFLPTISVPILNDQIVSETGDWAGVPAQFFHRVRNASEVKNDILTSLPADAPTFSPVQHKQITKWLEQARIRIQ
jgi:hypothetical protein